MAAGFGSIGRGRRLWAVLVALLFVAAAAAYLIAPGAEPRQDGASPPLSGDMAKFILAQPPAPAAAIGFTDREGKARNLRDFSGKVVLLNLWATWCAPCVAEMPSLDRLQAEMSGPEFEVVALSLDKTGDAVVAPFFAKTGVRSLKTYLDPSGAALRALKVGVLPTTILIDKAGNEIGRMAGDAKWDGDAAKALIAYAMRR